MRHASIAFSILIAAVICGCASLPPESTAMAPVRSGRVSGYLAKDALPDSRVLSARPPAAGSTAQALDDEVSRQYLALQGTARWDLAALDANLNFPQGAQVFSCVLNAPVTPEATPVLYTLLRRSMNDAGGSTGPAKGLYQRARPFMVNGKPTCTPADEDILRKNGSYPSGHSAAGSAWSLILAEISPERAEAILARGRFFAQSRLVCNVHWYSDTVEGMALGAATVARLHADPVFQADLAKARQELADVRAKGLPVTRDCAAEAEALKATPLVQ
ncbi:MAG: phosphatase PAP2 family protein [Steroidobacteraceae bacterium]